MTVQPGNTDALSEFLKLGITLPALPRSTAQVFELARKPPENLNTQEVIDLAQSDPTLTAEILRVANTSSYGGRGNIKYVPQAVVRIGLTETIRTLSYFAMFKALPRFEPIGDFTFEACWSHALACGTAAKMLARPEYLVQTQPGELYLAGLLHGVGKVVLGIHHHEAYKECLTRAKEQRAPLYQVEREVLGFDNAMLASQMLRNWELPAIIPESVSAYLDPAGAKESIRESAALLQLAYSITNGSEVGFAGEKTTDHQNCWIIAQKSGPLANEEVWRRAVEEIQYILKTKNIDLSEKPEDEECERQKTTESPRMKPEPNRILRSAQPKEPAPNRGTQKRSANNLQGRKNPGKGGVIASLKQFFSTKKDMA